MEDARCACVQPPDTPGIAQLVSEEAKRWAIKDPFVSTAEQNTGEFRRQDPRCRSHETCYTHYALFSRFMLKNKCTPLANLRQLLHAGRKDDATELMLEAQNTAVSTPKYFVHITQCRVRMAEVEAQLKFEQAKIHAASLQDGANAFRVMMSSLRTQRLRSEREVLQKCLSMYEATMRIAVSCSLSTPIAPDYLGEIVRWIDRGAERNWTRRTTRIEFILNNQETLFTKCNILETTRYQQLCVMDPFDHALIYARAKLHSHGCVSVTVTMRSGAEKKFLANVSLDCIRPISEVKTLRFYFDSANTTNPLRGWTCADQTGPPKLSEECENTPIDGRSSYLCIEHWVEALARKSVHWDVVESLEKLSIQQPSAPVVEQPMESS